MPDPPVATTGRVESPGCWQAEWVTNTSAVNGATEPAALVRFGTKSGRWVLLGMVLGSGMVSLDATVVNVALPRLGTSLHTDFAGLQWVLNGYTLTLASLILIGGSLGDRLGRRKVFTIGVVWF